MLAPTVVALILAAGPDRIPVFDGRLSPKPAAATPAEVALLKKEVLPAARKAAAGDDACDEAFEVLDVAQGSFTRAGASERIVLYRYCITGHGMGWSGLAVLEAGKVVAQVSIDATTEYALGVLPDLDGDGRAELVLASGGVGMGESWEVAAIVGWSGSGVRKLGILQAYHDDCGNVAKGREAFRLLATPGAKPSFVQQAFTGRCEGKRWTRRGGETAVIPGEDGREYVLLGRGAP